jgi:hypothetical protein
MARFNYTKFQHAGKIREPAFDPKPRKNGPWTHVKRGPVKVYTPEGIAAYAREHGNDNAPEQPLVRREKYGKLSWQIPRRNFERRRNSPLVGTA